MELSRRIFLKQGALALAAVGCGLGPAFLQRAVFAAPLAAARKRRTLVVIFQRGAVDGLAMLAPFGDPTLKTLRPDTSPLHLAVGGAEGLVDLDGFYGLHPALQPLVPWYRNGHLALVHACGSPHRTRSHFEAQDYMESALPGEKSSRPGWLARVLEACPEDTARLQTIRAVAMGVQLPRSLQGDDSALAISDLGSFSTPGAAMAGGGAAGFEGLYQNAVDQVLRGTGRDTFDALKALSSLDPTKYVPANNARYPTSPLGTGLRQIAQLIRANVGLEVACTESGGWDTHANQGGARGNLARRLGDLAASVAALATDLGDQMNEVVVLTMSEFGRTARPNGSGGTDHGHGTCFFLLGGQVKGGRVAGKWPGLQPEQLHEGRDLQVTTDFRDLFGEVALRHLGARATEGLFPGYGAKPERFPGVIKV